MDNETLLKNKSLLRQLEHSLKTVGAQSRNKLSIQGFDIFIDPHSDAYHLSFAAPSSLGKGSWAEAIGEMKQIFSERGRRARLEYFHELYPDLAEALEKAGFNRDMRAPVMILLKKDFSDPESPGGYLKLTPENSNLLEGYLRRQSLAYGDNGGDGALAWLDSMKKGLQTGDLMVGALELSDEFVSGASIQIGGGVGELAGVWTLPEKQKQGLAYKLCQRLLNDYFDQGYDLCWLSAAKGALRLYEKLGFKVVGTQLNYGSPEG